MMIVEGVVAHGRRLGRELGFPTANLYVEAGFDMPDGVYESRAEVDGVQYVAISNLGCNPTVGGSERRLETYLLDFEGSLYGRVLRVELCRKIRDERTFASLDDLKAQIAADRDEVIKLNKHL